MPSTAYSIAPERDTIRLNVVICTYNRARRLGQVFDCLAAQCDAPSCEWDVLVVDNASTDDTRTVTEAAIEGAAIPSLRYVYEATAGLTPARRRGVAESHGDWIAFVDDDNMLEPGWIAAMAQAIRAHPDAGGIGGEIRLAWEMEPPAYLRPFGFCFAEQKVGDNDRIADNLAGAGMVLRREAIVATGWTDGPLLEDRIGKSLVSGGDVEIAQRIRNAGYQLWLTPGAVLDHAIPAERMDRNYLLRMNRELGTSSAVVSLLTWAGDWQSWREHAWNMQAHWIRISAYGLFHALRNRQEIVQALAWAAFALGYMRGLFRSEALPRARRDRLMGAGAENERSGSPELSTGPVDDAPGLAILPWGDVIEEFLSPLGLDAHQYLQKADGGWLFGYVAALQAQGFRPVVFWGSRTVSQPERLAHPATGASVWLFPAAPRPEGQSPASISVRRWLDAPVGQVQRLIRRENCRAIITQEYEDVRFDRWIELGRELEIPVFASFQGGDRAASELEEKMRPHVISRAAGLIVPSAAERRRIGERYGRSLPPIAAIPNPIDVDRWQGIDRAEARRELGLPLSQFIAITHGRIDIYRKGLDVLVEAWGMLSDGEDDRLVIIGSGQDNEAFASLVAEKGAGRILWQSTYDTDRERIRTWLSAADMYVTASRIEGMPVAPLEAMACGLPIVASDAQGLDDILEGGRKHGGLLVARDDAAALAQAIALLRADPTLRAELGRAGRNRVETAFSIETVGSALASFLKPALSPIR